MGAVITIGMFGLLELASAGTLFYVDGAVSSVQAMDTRTFALTDFASRAGLGFPVAGLAFDENETFLMHIEEPGWAGLTYSVIPYTSTVDVSTQYGLYSSDYARTNVIVFDPTTLEVVVFAGDPTPGIYHLGGSKIADSIRYPTGATWDPNLGGFLVVDAPTGDLYAVLNYGPPQLVGTAPAAADFETFGLAYDQDTNIIWLVTSVRGIFGLDPFTYEQVAWLPSPPSGSFGATSQNYDPVPDFEPELLVTGTCPGEVFVTAIDHTPGGQVKIFSGTRPGTLVSPPGAPCAGASLGIRNPVLRGTLTANSLGLASTKFQAPASMCGSWRFQAVDVSTCTPSSVRGLP
jgi:hypothetical protein